MKIFKIILLAVVTTCLTFSCSSDDDDASSSASLVGTWKWTSSSENGVDDPLTECDLLDTYTFTSTQATYLEYYSDNDMAPCEFDTYMATYTISGNVITFTVGSEVYTEDIELTASTLTFIYQEDFNSETFIYKDVYTKQ